MYSFHRFLICSGSVSSLPVSSLIAVPLPLNLLFVDNFFTFAYTKSDRPLPSNSSNSLHSFSHHFSFAFSVSLLNSLCNCLYFSFQIVYLCFSTFFFPPFYSSSPTLSRVSLPLFHSCNQYESLRFPQLFLLVSSISPVL